MVKCLHTERRFNYSLIVLIYRLEEVVLLLLLELEEPVLPERRCWYWCN
jgi:hypothetical protein